MNNPSTDKDSLFRKSALERISSPEQLNDYIRVTHPGTWLLLIGLSIILATFGIWIFSGSVAETIHLNGIAFAPREPVRSVFSYVRMKSARRLREGMPVQISPDYAPRDRYGFIYGRIVRIGTKPISESDILERFGDKNYLRDLLPREGNAVEIEMEMDATDGRLKWSNPKGEEIRIDSGSECSLSVVIRERRPYELVFQP